jgi:uncharacterized protein (TIGR02117 family)
VRAPRATSPSRVRSPRRDLVCRALAILIVAATVLTGAACAHRVPDAGTPRPDETLPVVYVIGHGWHTGIVLQRAEIPVEAWPELEFLLPTTYVEVGWGDRTFYETPQAGVSLAIKAAFASDASALHVASFDRPPGEMFAGAEIVAIPLSPQGLAALGRFVSRAYALDAAGRPVELGPGLYAGSRFYAATGRYSILRTCNNWIAEALRAGGCPIDPAWAITAGAALSQAERCRDALRPSRGASAAPGRAAR